MEILYKYMAVKHKGKMRKLEINRLGTYIVKDDIGANCLVQVETLIPLLRATLVSSSLHPILSQNQIAP